MKKKITLLLFGFCLMILWSICFMITGMSDSYTAAMGLSFTFLSLYFLQKAYHFDLSAGDKIAILAFPILYDIGAYFVLYDNGYFNPNKRSSYQLLFYIHLINPINIALLVSILGLTKLKDLSKPANAFIFVYITLFYSYIFHHTWMYSWTGTGTKNFDTEQAKGTDGPNANSLQLDSTVNLFDYSFIGHSLDTAILKAESGRFILLETWAETCFPCIKAMNELPDFYQSIEDKVDVYYVYENNKARVRKQFDMIFNFKSIKDKSKIRIDIDQSLYDTLAMQGFPYFLLFDSNGKLIYLQRGYTGKEATANKILEKIGSF